MISKNYDLKSFKMKAAQTSDLLKSKGYDIPKMTLLNSLSFFMGEKNWNTMQAALKKANIADSDSDRPSSVDLNITTAQGFLGGASSTSKDSSHCYKFLQHEYSLATLKQLANQLGFPYTDDNDVAFCVPHLDYISQKIQENEHEVNFKKFMLSLSYYIPQALCITEDNNIMRTEAKRPYDFFFQSLIHRYEIIGDETVAENCFIFYDHQNQESNIFLMSVTIILLSILNKSTPGFLKNMIIKIRGRNGKMNITLYSLFDAEEISNYSTHGINFSQKYTIDLYSEKILFEKNTFHVSRTDRFL